MEEKMYKERMLVEFEELVTRTAYAKKYIKETHLREDKDLLIKQINAMEDYKIALAQRILREMGRY